VNAPPTSLAAEGQAFEEVAPGDIEQALERQRRSQENGGGAVVRASVSNLVVVTRNRAAGQRALAAVEGLGTRAPSRCVVLIAEPPDGRPGVRAWARVVHRRPDAGPELVWEEVVVQTNVHPRHLTAVVLPLLLPELPVFTWWEGTPPFAEEVFDELVSVTDRLIVDSAAFADPVADLTRLAKTAAVIEPAVSDCAWGRLTPWRELLAAPFGGPPLREAVDRARWLRVDAVEPTAGLELVGWFASRLGWELQQVRQVGDERLAGYRAGTGACQARVVGALGSANLTRVHLEVETAEGPASVRVEAPPGHLVATVEVPGQPTARRKVGRSSGAADPAGLGQELQVFGRDRVFEQALVQAAALGEGGGSG
jgi:glucose-6-phosphate dehydrogenase assembly protein OpcA